MLPYAIIGAGPMGLCTARRLNQYQIPWIGFEIHRDVGGLWDIDNPTSTMYQSAHLISSKKQTEFAELPMDDSVPTYPSHQHLKAYFQKYARHFDLYQGFRFGHTVNSITPQGNHWRITAETDGQEVSYDVAGVLLANGTLHHPNRTSLKGDFSGQHLHAAQYKDPQLFKDKRVLIIGCGNSGCDIAVDAVHQAKSVDMSVRRGYYFLPKFIKGQPTDSLGGKIKLPKRLKQTVDSWLIRMIIGKPSDYGLPDPDYRIYESHPVINSLFLHHIGHGDITPRPAIKSVSDKMVEFSDGSSQGYDLILEATGYKLHYPFIDKKHLNWQGYAPQLHLNVFNPEHNNIFVMGMVEAAGLGWQGRDDQAHLVALYLRQKQDKKASATVFEQTIEQQFAERVVGGMDYLELERMAYYVDKASYLKAIHQGIRLLQRDYSDNDNLFTQAEAFLMLTDVQIHFDPQSLILLNGILALMMFGVSLTLKPDDFKQILRSPIAPTIGLLAQFMVLPAATALVTWVFDIDPELALGMILVASCPGGSFSNIMTHIGRGNVAVSVSMTAVSSLAAIVMTPFNFVLYGQLNPVTRPLIQEIAIQPFELFLLVTLVLAIPLLLGMVIGQLFPRFAERSDTPFRFLSLLVFMVFIVIAVSNNVGVFIEHMGSFALLVVAHNALALLIGMISGYLVRLNTPDRRAVTLEVGIQNSGLALGILFTFFPQYGGMLIIAAFWGVLHLVTGLSLALIWNARSDAREARYANS